MVFSADDRGQAIVVGAVLVFGIMVLALALYQSQIVPAENRQIEFDHHETVQQRMVDLRNALLTSAAADDGRPAGIPLGTQYPTRVFAVNPPPPAGQLQTSELGTVTLSNAEAVNGEIDDYLNGSNVNVETKKLVYRADYSETQRPTSFVYEGSLLYSALPADAGGAFVEAFTSQEIIQGSTIRVTALQGNLSVGGTRSVSVEPAVLSGGYSAVQITNASDGPVVLTLPTDVPVEEWRRLIDSPRVRSVTSVRNGTAIQIELEPGRYTLKMAKLAVGSGGTDPGPKYVIPKESSRTTVAEGTTQELSFVVRDRFNNPVSNAKVNLTGNESVPGILRGPDGTVLSADEIVRTNEDGEVTLTYEAPEIDGAGPDIQIAANISGDPKTGPDPEFASIVVTVMNSDGSGDNGSDGGGNVVNPSGGDLIIYKGVVDYNQSQIEILLENTDTDVPRVIEEAKFSFFSADEQGQTAADIPDSLEIEGRDVRLMRNGEYEEVNLLFAPGQQQTLNLTFYKNDALYTDISAGDFLILSVIYDNGTTADFFISPASSPVGGAGGGGGNGGGAAIFNSTNVTDNSTQSGNTLNIEYDLGYEVDGTDFRNVEVVVKNESGAIVQTYNSTAGANSFTFSETRQRSEVGNSDYEFVFRLYDDNGSVIDTVTVTDNPDGTSPRVSTIVDVRIDTH